METLQAQLTEALNEQDRLRRLLKLRAKEAAQVQKLAQKMLLKRS